MTDLARKFEGAENTATTRLISFPEQRMLVSDRTVSSSGRTDTDRSLPASISALSTSFQQGGDFTARKNIKK